MSIINEALKKASRERDGVPSQTYAETVKKSLQIGESLNPSVNWGPIFVILVLVLITAPILAPMFSSPFKRENRDVVRRLPVVSAPTAAETPMSRLAQPSRPQFAVEETSPFAPRNLRPEIIMPYLRLSGIVYSSKEAYCIINNKVVKIDQEIQGATLTEILQDRVVLRRDDKEILLRVNEE